MISLSENEKKLLKLLKEKNQIDIEEAVKKLGINKDGVKRSAYFLSEKGLAEIELNKQECFEITKEGEKGLKESFIEENIENYEGKRIGELDNKIKERIWILRDGFIVIDKGVVKRGRGKYKLREALEKIKKGEMVEDKRILKFMEKEGLIKKVKKEEIKIKITKKGRVFKEEKTGIGELTREVILEKRWKEEGFKEYNIKKSNEKEERGSYHPLSIAIRKIKNAFLSLGFKEMSGNYVENSFWVFDSLFQPQDHPSRELADTFYIEGKSEEKIDYGLISNVKKMHEEKWEYKWSFEEARKLVLRTHTTALSSKTLYKDKKGKYFAVGRVFRNEAIDYKHLAEFHQIEGIVAWKNANFRNLLWIIKEFYKRLGFEKIRFRPSYFPYTEPSVEVDTYFEEKKEWIEIAGAGIFRKEVVEPLGAEYPVLAWGLSLERPLMIMLGIEDIREFYTNRKSWMDSIPYKKIFK